MVLVYRYRIPGRMYNFFIVSMILHLILVLFFSTRKTTQSGLFITEVSYMEEDLLAPEAATKPSGRVGYLIPPKDFEGLEGPGGGGGGGSGTGTIGPLTETAVEPVVDLSARLDRSQAEISLERYETEDEGALAIVRIADRTTGGVKSTEEILAEKPISLSKSLARAGSGGVGGGGGGLPIGGIGGGGLAPPQPTIKIETKPPPIRSAQTYETAKPVVEEKLATGTKKTSFSLAGPIAQRGIRTKVLPAYPAWCLQQGISGSVTIRFWVYADGLVKESMLVEISSGYPDLDQSVIEALKKWRFEPLPANVVQETQWGLITFHFVLS